MINRLSGFATEFFYTGLGIHVDHFMSEARRITQEDHLEWPIYRRLVIGQCALKVFFVLGTSLASLALGNLCSGLYTRKWTHENKGMMIFSTVGALIFTIFWIATHQYVNENVYSSFSKIFLSLQSAPSEIAKRLWNCLERHGAHVDCLDLIPSKNCTDEEKQNLSVTDDQVEIFIKAFSNLKKLKMDASQLTMQSLSQLTLNDAALTQLELVGNLNIPENCYAFLTELKNLRKLKIEHASCLSKKGFSSICFIASHLNVLHLGASNIDRSWLEQFRDIPSCPGELGFYSPHLYPKDFAVLFKRFGRRISSIRFLYHSNQDSEISQLISWLNRNFAWKGSWCRSIQDGTCEVSFVEDSDSDSDSD